MKTEGSLLPLLFFTCFSLQAQVHNDTVQMNQQKQAEKPVKPKIPASLQAEHKALHERLKAYTKLPGNTGVVAQELAKVLHPHFAKEEAYALPPLGLLLGLAEGKTTGDRHITIGMTDELKNHWPQMLAEHRQIVNVTDQLEKAAKDESRPDVVRFTESLKLHAKTEEEVLYPAAILVGEYLKRKGNH